MRKYDQYKKPVMSLAAFAIIAALTAIYGYVWYTSYANSLEVPFWRRGNYVVIGIYALISYFFMKMYGGFKIGYLRAFEVLYSQIFAVLCINFITYLQMCLIGRWSFGENCLPMMVMTVIDLVVVLAWIVLVRWAYIRLFPPRNLLMVYGDYKTDDIVRNMASRSDKYNIVEAISAYSDMEVIKEKIPNFEGVLLADLSAELRNKLLKHCFEKNVRCYCIPKISDIMIMSAEDIHLFDTALLLFRNQGLTPMQRFGKRAFDIAVSAVLLLLTSPIFAIIAIAIKAYDGGPVFFTQDRLTQDRKVFKILKFRSMKVSDGKGEYQLTRKDDDRITPVGHILRRSHFDELPQLVNIFLGDMSIVGPRPEVPEIAEKYCGLIPEFHFRLKVKAGLTGFAQVYGKYNTTPYEKLKLDLTYIEKYSFLLDIKLMLLTIKVMFQKETSEGVESWQKTAAKDNKIENPEKEEKND